MKCNPLNLLTNAPSTDTGICS